MPALRRRAGWFLAALSPMRPRQIDSTITAEARGSSSLAPTAAKIRDVLVVAGEQLSEFYRIGKERGLITSDIDADAMAHWWFSVLAGRHLIDLLDDDRITAQWEQMTTWSVQKVVLGD